MRISKTSRADRAGLYRLLARLYAVEADEALLDGLSTLRLPGDAAQPQMAEGFRRMRTWLDGRGSDAVEALAVDYAAVFLAAGSAEGRAAIPCESVYTSPKRLVMQEAWEDMRRLLREKNLGQADGEEQLMEDHLALELEYMAALVEEGALEEQQDFLERHLLNWVPAFSEDVTRFARQDFYPAVTTLTGGFLSMEREFLTRLTDPAEPEFAAAPSFSVRADRMENVLARLKEHYRVLAPMRLPGRGPRGGDLIRYGEISHLTDIEYREKSHFSAKEAFYPVSQTLFRFQGEDCTEEPLEDGRDILLFLRPCDRNAVERLDNIFLHNGQPDLYYSRLRQRVKFVLLECAEGFDNCFCVSMGTNVCGDYSAAVRIDDICALVEVLDEELLPYFQDEVPAEFTPQFVRANRRAARLPAIRNREELERACKLDFWRQYDDTCIACGTCNTVCPTCSCFDTVDIIYHETSSDGERRRVWSACMLADFTETAGGSRARKTQGDNMRFKVLHKVYDYQLRFGGEGQMCVGCGRCIDRCPREIDYLDAVNGLTAALSGREEG